MNSREMGAQCTSMWRSSQERGVVLGSGRRVERADGQVDSGQCVKEMCATARRIIGLTPVEPFILELQMRSYGDKTMEGAMLLEAKNYLKFEMKVRPSVIEQLNIVRVFRPAKEGRDVLYVELGSEYQAESLFSYTKLIKNKDHRVVRWFPKEMFSR